MRRIVLVVLALAGVLAAPAQAAELVPAQHTQATLGAPVDFVIPAPVAGTRAAIVVAATPATDETGALRDDRIVAGGEATADPLDPSVLRWTFPPGTLPALRAGRYVWQALVAVPGAGEAVPTELRELTIVTPAPSRRRTRIARRFGRQGRGALAVGTTGMPAGISPDLFTATVATSARRWGLRAARTTTRRAGLADGHDVVGFGPGVPATALGVQKDVVHERIVRRTRCTATGCRVTRKVISRRVERDIVLRQDLAWWLGPEPPDLDHFDVESVLIHELGHFARNPQHKPRCANSPMTIALGAGEWWRTPRDRWAFCGATAASGRTLAPPRRLEFAHDRVVRRVVVGR
jgi:hypothetical protein